jgi:hypothetical protein
MGPAAPVPFLVGTFLVGTFLVGTFLVGTFLVGTFLVGTFLVGTFLVGTFLVGTFLVGTFLVGTFLVGTFLVGTFLVGTFLVGTFLVGTFLAVVFFGGAFFGAAFLGGAFFGAAFLGGAFTALLPPIYLRLVVFERSQPIYYTSRLCSASPSFSTYITNVHIFHVDRVILDINDVTLCPTVTRARSLRALHVLYVWQSGVLPGEFIQQDTIPLTRPLLYQCLNKQTTTLLLLYNPA